MMGLRRKPWGAALAGAFVVSVLVEGPQASAQPPTTPIPTRLSQVPYQSPVPEPDYGASLRRAKRVRITGGVFLTVGFGGLVVGAGLIRASNGARSGCDVDGTAPYDDWDYCSDYMDGLARFATVMFTIPFVVAGGMMIGFGGRRKRDAERALAIEVGAGSLRATFQF